MGMFDNLKGKADQLKEKASGLVDQHGDKIDKGLDKAGEIVDQKTGGKYTEQIATGKAKAREQLDNLDGQQGRLPAGDAARPDRPGRTDPAGRADRPDRAAQPALSRASPPHHPRAAASWLRPAVASGRREPPPPAPPRAEPFHMPSPSTCREPAPSRNTRARPALGADMQPPRFPRVVDDVTVRLIAAVVLVLAVLALVTHQWWIYAVLALDFTLRAALGPRVSPLAQLVQRAVRPRVRRAEAADGRAAQAVRRGDRRRPDRRRDRPLAAARDRGRHRRGRPGRRHGRLPRAGGRARALRRLPRVRAADAAGGRARGDLPGVRRHQPAPDVGQRRQMSTTARSSVSPASAAAQMRAAPPAKPRETSRSASPSIRSMPTFRSRVRVSITPSV